MFFYFIIILFLLIAFYYIVNKFFDLLIIKDLSNCPVLISGCDTGFGYKLAVKCVKNNIPVFAGCKTQEGIDKLKRVVNIESYKNLLHPILLDVSNEESILSTKSYVEKKIDELNYCGLHALINNAGIVGNSAWDDWLTPSDYEIVWRVNTLGVIGLTHAFKSLIRKQKGRIITMSSICGRVSIPGLGPYSVSKYGVEAYCDTIRLELSRFGIKVSILEPGFFKTPLTNPDITEKRLIQTYNNLSKDLRELYNESFLNSIKNIATENLKNASLDTNLVIDAYYHAITSMYPRKRYIIGNDAQYQFIPISFLPTEIQDLLFHFYGLFKMP